ncbi:MAG: glycosyltransferase [Candidatus Dormiibacterota bacterium]
MEEVQLPALAPGKFRRLMGQREWSGFTRSLERGQSQFQGRTLWHVNSTAQGGGVAEMLQSVLCYLVGAGITTRWTVIEGNENFFDLTKRIHNLLHGSAGDGGDLSPAEMATYDATLTDESAWLTDHMQSGDVVVLHDPQALGLAPALEKAGALVVWACHIGRDQPNKLTRSAWRALLPYARAAQICTFSRPQYAWEGLDQARVVVIPPCLDAFSPKNQRLEKPKVAAILNAAKIVPSAAEGKAEFTRQDGSRARVSTPARVIEEAPIPVDVPIVTQISRWDPLKDMTGVMSAFIDHVPEELEAHLVLAGPDPEAVADDPEGQETFQALKKSWKGLSRDQRERVHLACLPMDDLEQNAASVNALQRRADVVVQKSLAEGFGLTVAEAMWKSRPVVGSRLGGIQDQIEAGRSGLLVDDPRDLKECGAAVTGLLLDRRRSAAMGKRAHQRVGREYLAPIYLGRYLNLFSDLM